LVAKLVAEQVAKLAKWVLASSGPPALTRRVGCASRATYPSYGGANHLPRITILSQESLLPRSHPIHCGGIRAGHHLLLLSASRHLLLIVAGCLLLREAAIRSAQRHQADKHKHREKPSHGRTSQMVGWGKETPFGPEKLFTFSSSF